VKKSKKTCRNGKYHRPTRDCFSYQAQNRRDAEQIHRFRLSPSMKRVTAGNRRADFFGAGAFQAEIKSKPKGIK
jgi:hypothetical protein